jgi:hypothetical protein
LELELIRKHSFQRCLVFLLDALQHLIFQGTEDSDLFGCSDEICDICFGNEITEEAEKGDWRMSYRSEPSIWEGQAIYEAGCVLRNNSRAQQLLA